MAGEFAVFRLGPRRLDMGVAVRPDGPRARDGPRDRIDLYRQPATARVVRDDSLYLAQTAVSRHLGCVRAAIPQRLRAVDDEANAIRRRRRVPAEVLIGHCWLRSDVVPLWHNEARGGLMGNSGRRFSAGVQVCRPIPSGVVCGSYCGTTDRIFGIALYRLNQRFCCASSVVSATLWRRVSADHWPSKQQIAAKSGITDAAR